MSSKSAKTVSKKAPRTITGGKRKVTSVSSTSLPASLGPNPTLKQLEKMGKQMETFTGAVATLQELVGTRTGAVEEHCSMVIAQFDADVLARRDQIENLTREFEQKYNDNRIETAQSLREFGLAEAAKIATKDGQELVNSKELAALRQNVRELRDTLATQSDEIRASLKTEFTAKLEAATARIKLTEAKERATIDAQHKAAQGEIRILKEQLEHAHKEVAASRELVSSVANARSSQPIMVSAPASRSDR